MSAVPAAAATASKKNPALSAALARLLQHDTAGDPCGGLRWVRRTTSRLADALTQLGFPLCDRTVARLLRADGFALRVNHKSIPSVSPTDRNAQFECIADLKRRCAADGSPLVSVDTKKRELVGNFKNPGAAWERQPVQVNDHDFRSQAQGLAVPYGIYDLHANAGTVLVGQSHDTPFFAVDCLDHWWRCAGRARYPHATLLTVLADCGGSNGYRPRAWKCALQHRFCNPHRLSVRVAHYPPGPIQVQPDRAPPLQRNQQELGRSPTAQLGTHPQLHPHYHHPHRPLCLLPPAPGGLPDRHQDHSTTNGSTEPHQKPAPAQLELHHLSEPKLSSYFFAYPQILSWRVVRGTRAFGFQCSLRTKARNSRHGGNLSQSSPQNCSHKAPKTESAPVADLPQRELNLPG